VAAASNCVASLGLIAAAFAVYGEGLPGGPDTVLLVVGGAVSVIGTALLVGRGHERVA